jgi:murein DD-endopeptidase MepM/ murein hydrolase activator NlpD
MKAAASLLLALLPLAGAAADAPDAETRCAIGRFRHCDTALAVRRGLFETGLVPVFPPGTHCRGIDEGFAISYTHKRRREAWHGGIDMPAPAGTPILAAAAGTVVAVYHGEHSFRGIQVVLRHAPEDTGLPAWIYTQYAHLSALPALVPGQRVRLGQVLGPTGNSGIDLTGVQSVRRRPAIHFAAFFSAVEGFADLDERIIPVDGRWMDPVALYRGSLPLDSQAMRALPEADKRVDVAVLLEDGTMLPAGAKIVWPYACTGNEESHAEDPRNRPPRPARARRGRHDPLLR